MAIAQLNLAELLMKARRWPDAGGQLAESVANLEKLAAEAHDPWISGAISARRSRCKGSGSAGPAGSSRPGPR